MKDTFECRDIWRNDDEKKHTRTQDYSTELNRSRRIPLVCTWSCVIREYIFLFSYMSLSFWYLYVHKVCLQAKEMREKPFLPLFE
jgi:hypothetical protein